MAGVLHRTSDIAWLNDDFPIAAIASPVVDITNAINTLSGLVLLNAPCKISQQLLTPALSPMRFDQTASAELRQIMDMISQAQPRVLL